MAGVSNGSSVYYPSSIFSSNFCAGMITVGTHTGDVMCLVSLLSRSQCLLLIPNLLYSHSICTSLFPIPLHIIISRFINMQRIPCCWMPSAAPCCLKKCTLEVLCLSVQDAISPSADWSRLSCFLLFYCFFYCFLCFFFHDFLQIVWYL